MGDVQSARLPCEDLRDASCPTEVTLWYLNCKLARSKVQAQCVA